MKKIFFAFSFILLSDSSHAFLSSHEIILNKDLKNKNGIYFTAHTTLKSWCSKIGTALELGSFQAAKDLEKLEDGLFRCQGQFVKLPAASPLQAFSLESCVALDPTMLVHDCIDNDK